MTPSRSLGTRTTLFRYTTSEQSQLSVAIDDSWTEFDGATILIFAGDCEVFGGHVRARANQHSHISIIFNLEEFFTFSIVEVVGNSIVDFN